MAGNEYSKIKNKARMSLTLLILAVITITTATYAWFTIVNNSSVHDISLDVTAGTKLRIDTDFSVNIEDYTDTVTKDMINAQIKANLATYGFDEMAKLRLAPLTSGDGVKLYTQNGNTINTPAVTTSGSFLELTLWFISPSNMDVYLNESPSVSGKDDGTYFRSNDLLNNAKQKPVERCTRMSVIPYYNGTADAQVLSTKADDYSMKGTTNIYEPNKTVATKLTGQAKKDGGDFADQDTFGVLGTNVGLANGIDKTQVLFKLKENIPVKVVVKIWIEGEDPECVNAETINIEKAKFNALLRFCGAGTDGSFME